ncbi:MAG: YdcF family protein [Clostridia bacterium]|nr:YdcF family protein [Clostridia bacterium]
MRKAVKQLAVCAALVAAVCVACVLLFCRGYTVYVPSEWFPEGGRKAEDLVLTVDRPEVLHAGELTDGNGRLRFDLTPGEPGEAVVYISARDGGSRHMQIFRVMAPGIILDRSSAGFTGDWTVLFGAAAMWLLTGAVMLWHFFRARGSDFYTYGTIYYAGFSIFSFASGAVTLSTAVWRVSAPWSCTMFTAYDAIRMASSNFMEISAPLILAFAAAMAVSNIALLRHERLRPQNLLGLLIAVLLVAGEAVGWYLFTRDFSGSEWEVRVRDTLTNTYATVFVYCECMLAGAVICGICAAHREPAPDKNCIIILGCWFRPDGTLPPLLRGRVDRAVAFWRKQRDATGRTAWIIPSGGQGPNEPMPEAQAMRAYLLGEGIPDELILPEEKSATTLENMAFSREILQAHGGGKAVFSTTGYHVFRSGVWARRAGLRAEGIGSRTKWWFWPNAFMREAAGLLYHRRWQELLLLVILIVFFGALSMLLG